MAPPPPPTAFYLTAGPGRYLPTAAAQSPWGPDTQHGGPPTALLAAAITDHVADPGLRVGRVSVDFLGPIPLAEGEVRVRTLRPGRRIRLVEAELRCADAPVVVARAWLLAVRPGGPATPPHAPAPPLPPPGAPEGLDAFMDAFGYGRAHEWRPTAPAGDGPLPPAVWARPRVPLVAGRPTSGVERLLTVAGSANGVSLRLPPAEWLSVPPGLTVTVLREPAGEWVHLRARTHLAGDGIGLCEGELADADGLAATVSQPLLVAPRG